MSQPGGYLGKLTTDGHDGGTKIRLTFRDPDGKVTMVLGEDEPLPPVYGTRMRPGIPDFMGGPPEVATPAN